MTHIVSQVDIATSPGAVWAVLTDFAGYAAWNPFIPAIDGRAVEGTGITVHIAVAGAVSVPVKAEIVTLRPDEKLVWRSHFLKEGLFDRDHIFEIEANATGCIVRQTQTFDGPIAPAAAALTTGVVQHGLDAMNAALKRRAEEFSRG